MDHSIGLVVHSRPPPPGPVRPRDYAGFRGPEATPRPQAGLFTRQVARAPILDRAGRASTRPAAAAGPPDEAAARTRAAPHPAAKMAVPVVPHPIRAVHHRAC